MPPFPKWRFLDIPVAHMRVNRIDAEVNYMQQLEGGADTSHVGILHSNFARPGWMTGAFSANTDQDNPAALATADLAPTLLLKIRRSVSTTRRSANSGATRPTASAT